MSSDDLFRLPEEISEDQAAATILKAATTEALVERCANFNEGDTALVHAAAGGVGPNNGAMAQSSKCARYWDCF